MSTNDSNNNINPISNNNSNSSNNPPPNNDNDPWKLDDVTNRQKLVRYIIDWVKEGATDDELLDILTPDFFRRNNIPPFERRDIQGIIDWARRKFPKDTK
jgi:hypothetical protein